MILVIEIIITQMIIFSPTEGEGQDGAFLSTKFFSSCIDRCNGTFCDIIKKAAMESDMHSYVNVNKRKHNNNMKKMKTKKWFNEKCTISRKERRKINTILANPRIIWMIYVALVILIKNVLERQLEIVIGNSIRNSGL